MPFLKRIEVWVLLVVGVGLSWWALKPAAAPPTRWEAAAGEAADQPPQRLTLRGAQIERDYGNARLDLTLAVRNDGIHPLRLSAPKLRLLAGEREVPAFFLPADRLPEVAPQSASEVQLRYWLEAADLQGPLVLDLEGEQTPVKSATPYPLDPLKNGELVTLRGVEW
jgi:hypothetical protein